MDPGELVTYNTYTPKAEGIQWLEYIPRRLVCTGVGLL